MLPERTFLDIVDEANSCEIHVCLSFPLDNGPFGDIAGSWGIGY
jgi:hypothetical protein